MCGRFTYASEFRDIRIRFNLEEEIPLFRPRYNVAPGQEVAVIFSREGTRSLTMMQWGLIPSWAKDPAIGNKISDGVRLGKRFRNSESPIISAGIMEPGWALRVMR